MPQSRRGSYADQVRQYVSERYIKPVQLRGQHSFRVVVGDVHRALGFQNRVPLVYAALRSRKFLKENQLVLKMTGGPPQEGPALTLTYEFLAPAIDSKPPNSLADLRGAARDLFCSLGGGEAFIRNERKSFY